MGKRRSTRSVDGTQYEKSRHMAALPPERVLEQPMVYWPDTDRLIAPWPRAGGLTFEQERVLLAC